MPLDLLELSTQVRQMGELLAHRREDEQRRLRLLDGMLAEYRDRWEELADLAETVQERVAVPTGPLDERIPPAPRPESYTAMATDGAEIDPDRHGGSGDFYLINVGRVRIPYGQPEREVELRSVSNLGYTDEDLFIVDPRDPRRQVPMRDRHLDALRTVEELRALADLAEAESRVIASLDPSFGKQSQSSEPDRDPAEGPGRGLTADQRGGKPGEGESQWLPDDQRDSRSADDRPRRVRADGRREGERVEDEHRQDIGGDRLEREEASSRSSRGAEADGRRDGERVEDENRQDIGGDRFEREKASGRSSRGAEADGRRDGERGEDEHRQDIRGDRLEREKASSRAAPAVALVDGTLLFSVLEERPRDFLRNRFYTDFVFQLERLRRLRIPVAAYASRSRGIDLIHLFRAVCGSTPLVCDVCNGAHACALRGLNDAHLIGRSLHRWERTGLFRVRSNVHDPYYGIHRVYFFLLATGDEIARIEIPEWVARDQHLLGLLHAVLVDQCTKGFGYPAVLARADDRAVISLGDRSVLDTLVQQELARRGVVARPSAKLSRKQVRSV